MDDLLRELQTPVEDWIQACVGLGVLAWAFRMAWEHWDGLLGMPGRYAITISGFVFLAGPAIYVLSAASVSLLTVLCIVGWTWLVTRGSRQFIREEQQF